MASFEPLHIRAHLRTGVVADKWLPLDGILFYQAVRDSRGPQVMTTPGECLPCHENTLPLAVANLGTERWYYRCSWARWSHDVEGTDYWNKRFDSQFADLVDFGRRRGKVQVGKGKYKSYHMPVFYRAALWVEWWCMGNMAEIECLLSTATHVGKKRSQGWGRVRQWEIKPVAADWSVWRDGKLTRGIPAGDVVAERPFNLMLYGLRPSYWRRENQIPLAMPE